MLEKTVEALRRDGGLYPLSALAIIIAALLIAVAYWRLIGPTNLKISVAPAASAEADLVDAFSTILVNGRRGVRLVVKKEASLDDAARELESGRADLAIVRPDAALPSNGLTIAILRQEAIFIVHPADVKLAGLPALAGMTLAVAGRSEADETAVRSVLAFHDLQESVRIERMDAAAIPLTIDASRASAVAFIAAPGSPEARKIARALAHAYGKPLALMALPHGDPMSVATPGFSSLKIPAGGLLANPALPAEEIDGIAVSWRLMARSGLDRGPISTLTERLFESRIQLARSSPVATTMKAPDSDSATSAILPNHRGALDYFNREQLTFMDRYGDWLWFALFAATGVSSAFAWIGRMFTRRRREIIDEALRRLCRILGDARKAETLERLSEISSDLDRLIAISIWRARRRTTNARTISALMLATDAARAAVRERREELRDGAQNARSLSPPSQA